MKKIAILCLSYFVSACGNAPISLSEAPPEQSPYTSNGDLEGLSLICSSSGSGVLTCESGQTIPMPPLFPYSEDCNECLTTVTDAVAFVKCPNGLSFNFPLLKGEKGDKGDKGSTGAQGATGQTGATGATGQTGAQGPKGDKGHSCSVGTDGWVRCTDGTSYQLLQGPKGDKGDKGSTGAQGATGQTGAQGATGQTGATGAQGPKGDRGVAGTSCHTTRNSFDQVVIRCTDGSEEVISCGGGGCWSFGARGNVYRLPVNTTTLPNFDTMTPVATAKVADFSIFNAPSVAGLPGVFYAPTFTDKEWYGIRWQGFIELRAAPSNNVCFRLTSDDGARFMLGTMNVEVVAMPNLQPPSSKTGCVTALQGRHAFRLDWFQGPHQRVALALEVSYDEGSTYRLVRQDELTHIVK